MKYFMSGANNNKMHNMPTNQQINRNIINSQRTENVNNEKNENASAVNNTNNSTTMSENYNNKMVMQNQDLMQSNTSLEKVEKRNVPNPPWPSMQPVVVMPPGSNPTSLGLPDANIYKNRLSLDTGGAMGGKTDGMQFSQTMMPQTGQHNMPQTMPQMMPRVGAMNYRISDMVKIRSPYMEDMTLSEYMAGRIGEYIKVDLCCGGVGNSKVGILREIGDDFIVLEDAESGNYMVCGMKGIQLIHVYDDGENE